MCPGSYYTMIRSKDHRFELRRALVECALTEGVNEATRRFATTKRTVRKWRNRYKAEGPTGLKERSRAPKRRPHKTPRADEALVIAQRHRTPGFGPERLKREFGLRPGTGAICRILREHGLTRKQKKKHQKKNDLREVKKKYAAFTRFKMDVKYLTDLAHYWPYMTAMELPKYEYTIVEVRVGAVFLAYADEYGVLESRAVAVRLLEHLKGQGIPLDQVLIQTDGGSEFEGTEVIKKPDGFTRAIESFGAKHRAVPGCPNAQAEAESLHSRIEPEFFDIQDFAGPIDFWHKIATWQNWYNLRRKNSSRGWRSPAENLRELQPERDLAIFLLPPVHVDTLLQPQGGYHVPAQPVCQEQEQEN
jgi:transposase